MDLATRLGPGVLISLSLVCLAALVALALAGRRHSPDPVRPAGWWLDLLMVAGFALVTLALFTGPAQRLDLAVMHWVDAHRPAPAEEVAYLFNWLGQGTPLTILATLIALVLAWRRRSGWPLAPVLAAFLATGIVILPLKVYFHRSAPHNYDLAGSVKVQLFSQDAGLSYPSGHAVNTVVWYGVLAVLLAGWLAPGARRWLRWTPPVVVGFTATYLGFHWFSDMIAGLCLGVLLDRLLRRIPYPALLKAPAGEPVRASAGQRAPHAGQGPPHNGGAAPPLADD